MLTSGFMTNAWCQVFNFENDIDGKTPYGFITDNSGNGAPAEWVVITDNTLPGSKKVLAQKSTEPISYRFPICINNSIEAADLTLSVKFKAVSGKKDQGAGLIWRYKDKGNYYIVRGNALEDNVVLYKFENGKRTDLAPTGNNSKTYGMDVPVKKTEWNDLKVIVKGNRFDIYFNGAFLFYVIDETFKGKGKVGLWTKADSFMLFDDFTVEKL